MQFACFDDVDLLIVVTSLEADCKTERAGWEKQSEEAALLYNLYIH